MPTRRVHPSLDRFRKCTSSAQRCEVGMDSFRKVRVVILGAGPAGISAASRLAQRQNFDVTVLEACPLVGGSAASFALGGLNVDFGSHRLHPACAPHVLNDIRSMLGPDLIERPRHGRIRLWN